jgi:hypothetical protein
MDRDQITSLVNNVLHNITNACSAVDILHNALVDAGNQEPFLAVVYEDIRHDASLPKLGADLEFLHHILDNAADHVLPAHFERLKPQPRIVTTHVNPPIPIRTSDWCACVEGTEEDGPYGWGRTEEEAIADLQEKLDDY